MLLAMVPMFFIAIAYSELNKAGEQIRGSEDPDKPPVP